MQDNTSSKHCLSSLCISNLYFNLKDRFYICSIEFINKADVYNTKILDQLSFKCLDYDIR